MTEPSDQRPTSKLAALWRSAILALFITPLCVLAPAGVLQFMGMHPTESPIFLSILVVFPIAVTALLYARTHRGKSTPDEVMERVFAHVESGFEGIFRGVGSCLTGIFVIGVVIFVALGVIGLLVMGVRAIF